MHGCVQDLSLPDELVEDTFEAQLGVHLPPWAAQAQAAFTALFPIKEVVARAAGGEGMAEGGPAMRPR